MTSTSTSNPQRPASITGLHHIKLPVSDLLRSKEFYTKILPFTHLAHFDHYTAATPQTGSRLFAVLLSLQTPNDQSSLILELRYAPQAAAFTRQTHWDPLTFSVPTRRDLERWAAWLDSQTVKHSPVFTSLESWILAAEDPDGRIVRFYVAEEKHEWSVEGASRDAYWLGGAPEGQPGTERAG